MSYLRSGIMIFVLLISGITGPGCSSDNASTPSQIAVKVNDVEISMKEFNDLLNLQAYSDPEMNLSPEEQKAFANYLIRKELMLQEAMRLKLDRQEDFVKTIETYWESTLIRTLLEYKSAKLNKQRVSHAEIKAYYQKNEASFDQPYDAVKDEIRKRLTTQKTDAAISDWIESIEDRAQIYVNPSLTQGTR